MPIQFSNWLWLLLLLGLIPFFCWQSARTITDLSAGRKRTALILRCLLVLLLTLSLAGLSIVRRGNSMAVVFLVDGSRSIPVEQRGRIEKYLKDAKGGMRSSDKASLVTFAQQPHTQSALGQPLNPAQIRDLGPTTATDMAEALRQGRNQLLSQEGRGSGKRIVVISDGNENIRHQGGALAEAASLAAEHVAVDTVTLPVSLTREALVDKVVMPPRVKIGEPFQVRVVVTSMTAQEATVALNRDGRPTGEARKVSLHSGKNVVVFDQNIDKKGFFRYTVTLDAPQDTIPENNRGEGFVWVLGKPTVLYVADSPQMTGFLRKTLQSENIDVEYASPEALPSSVAGLQPFDSVFLSNVPSSALSQSQMTALQTACRDFGIGFGMVGGQNSFGAGAYRGTPVEEALPVSMDVKQQKRLPSVAVALVIEDLEIPSTINMSIEAAKSTMDLLEPIDQVGVLDCQGFTGGDPTTASAAGTWRIKMQHVTDRDALKSSMQGLTDMGDPPIYDPFLLEAARVLNSTDAKVKHIVFLGDGDAVYEQNQKAMMDNLKKISDMGITVSTISTGADGSGQKFMAVIAALGHGQSYVADNPQDLPRLLLKDQETISQPPIIEEPFRPAPIPGDDILKGIDWNSAPPLLGYDVVSLKPMASMALIDPDANRNDPIFAGWRYGLGRSVAFMSDDRARWAAQWLGWPGYAKFWAQALRWTLRPFGPSDYDTQVTLDGNRGHVEVNAIDQQGHFVNRLQIRALIAPPDITSIKAHPPMEQTLEQTGPGRYEAFFDASQTGTYLVNVMQKGIGGAGPEHSTPVGLSIAYSPEYRDIHSNHYLMSQLARASSGRSDPPPQAIFGSDRPAVYSTYDLTAVLLGLALLLLPLDIAVRRLAVGAEDFERAVVWLRGKLRARERAGSATPELARLKGRKEEALAGRETLLPSEYEAVPTPVMASAATVERNGLRPEAPAQTSPGAAPVAVATRPASGTLRPERDVKSREEEAVSAPASPSEAEESGMSRLMAAKRRAQQPKE